jgi:dTDP-4-dehydrorhamnose reductase
MRVVVTGAAGQLGQVVVALFNARHDVVALTRSDVDLTNHDAVVGSIGAARPDVVINCSAYNAVDQAEDDASTALAVNAHAVRSLARAANEAGATLVHYSTDFVFDGTATQPYVEDDLPAPRSVYGQSKLLGEFFARDVPRHYVLRVESLFGGPRPKSSIDRIIEALGSDREARVFIDRVVSPSFVDDVATATEGLLAADAAPGLYHCVNTGTATWYDVGAYIAEVMHCTPRLAGVRVADVPMRAPRPQYCALSNEKLARAGVEMPTWQDAISRYVQRRAQ